MRSFMSININITFMHISWFILASKSTSFTFFIWIFTYSSHFYMEDLCTFTHFSIIKWCEVVGWEFVYMIYGKQAVSANCIIAVSRHLSRFEPSFISALDKICPWSIRAATPVLSRATSPRLYIGIYYWEKFVWHNSHTRTWENPGRFFCAPSHYIYCILLGKI